MPASGVNHRRLLAVFFRPKEIIMYGLPDGSIVSLASVYGAAKPVTALTNAAPPVATATAHGLANAALVEVTSGWNDLNARIARLSGVATNAFNLEGFDTSNTTRYNPGSGGGSVREVQTFVEIPQILTFTTAGGDQQFWTGSFLADNFERQLPTVTSAQSITIELADDPTAPAYPVLIAASDARAIRALKLVLPNGSILLYNGYVSFNSTPSLNKGQIMTTRAVFTLVGRPVRY
jgi:hypothetical protein